MDEFTAERMRELKYQGFFCSQILMTLGLELQGKDNPDLIRAMQGLAGGLGFSGETCGALTGGASLLGLYAGKGTPEEPENLRLNFMIEDLVKWFKDGYGQEYGGIRCADILAGNPNYVGIRCPIMVAGIFQKIKDLLIENGFDLAGSGRTNPPQLISSTESVCPVCLARLDAQRIQIGTDVYLIKTCPDHGEFKTILWRGQQPAYSDWSRPKIPAHPANPFTPVDHGCPFDCGLCPDHRQQTCTALIEVTQRCDLRCNFCFASAGTSSAPDPDLAQIESWYRHLLAAGPACNIQISGGEPTLRDDLPDIIALGRSLGFSFIQLNTHGLRLARDRDYVKRLKAAGLASVFLQFDGTEPRFFKTIRGVQQLERKRAAIAHCAEVDLGVVLVPVLIPGVNTHNLGSIIEFALEHFPTVRGVHFQPVTYLGRYRQAPADADRITIPEVIRLIEAQTGGALRRENFTTSGCENALCSLHGNFVVMPDGKLRSWVNQQQNTSCCIPQPAEQGAEKTRQFVAQHWSGSSSVIALNSIDTPVFGEWDVFLARTKTHTFCISGMAFQDAWTLDLERLRDCCIHTVNPDGRIIPFCAYNLTRQDGQTLYRGQQIPVESIS